MDTEKPNLINYHKRNNRPLFQDFEEKIGVFDAQNYIPIYKNFFNLTSSNFNNINLNHPHHIKSIKGKIRKNTYECEIVDMSGNNAGVVPVFFKFSPLIDPVKYVEGKYSLPIDKLKSLPNSLEYDVNPKTNDVNNAAYTDGFFSFLSSKLQSEYKIPHCIGFYGAFIGNQSEFVFDVSDDWEYMYESTFFCKHKDDLFYLDEEKIKKNYMSDSRSNKPKLSIKDNADNDIGAVNWNDDVFEDIFVDGDDKIRRDSITEVDVGEPSKDNMKLSVDGLSSSRQGTASTSSSYSSRTSNTDSNYDSDDSETDSEDIDEDFDEDIDEDDDSDDDQIDGTIIDFPVEVISQEVCKETLDRLMKTEDITIPMWRSILMQVIMNLLVYQKAFNFTHNDLHTNNVMYVETDREFLYYKVDGKYYKVPTFGKIFKIIDFGRAIYKYKGKTICSDSYHPTGDAATQYNCEPYFNDKKPRLEPHYGFDLCRLACALYDDLVDENEENDPLGDIIKEWCTDDNGKNILYKTSGIERYPDFKLYKMIARTVHKPTPKSQLQKDFFALYETAHKKINKKTKIVNIDTLPSLI